jgi:LmbE family N-acetylglucosaminyl deacetylase
MRVLCFAAHPDDETIGAGGTLARYAAEGAETFLLVATSAYEPRWSAESIAAKRDECLAAAEVLGIRDVRFLALKTMHLANLPSIDLADAISATMADVEPDVVLAPPCHDLNTDHAALFNAVNVATRATGTGAPAKLYSYEICTTTRFNVGAAWLPNTYVNISDWLEAKLKAMQCYQTELRQAPHPRSLEGLRIMAAERGAAMGMAAAEALMLVRELR